MKTKGGITAEKAIELVEYIEACLAAGDSQDMGNQLVSDVSDEIEKGIGFDKLEELYKDYGHE